MDIEVKGPMFDDPGSDPRWRKGTPVVNIDLFCPTEENVNAGCSGGEDRHKG